MLHLLTSFKCTENVSSLCICKDFNKGHPIGFLCCSPALEHHPHRVTGVEIQNKVFTRSLRLKGFIAWGTHKHIIKNSPEGQHCSNEASVISVQLTQHRQADVLNKDLDFTGPRSIQ